MCQVVSLSEGEIPIPLHIALNSFQDYRGNFNLRFRMAQGCQILFLIAIGTTIAVHFHDASTDNIV